MAPRSQISRTYLQAGMGIRINRAAAADPQNVWQSIFTVTGGAIMLTSLIGTRTVVQAGGASQMQFRHSIGPTVLDNGGLVITGQALGAIYVLQGDSSLPISAGVAGAPVFFAKSAAGSNTYGCLGCSIILSAGNIQVTMTAAAGTGSTRYTMTYIPMDDTAYVAAA